MEAGDVVKFAVGSADAVTVTSSGFDADKPRSLVTVRVTVNFATFEKLFCTTTPLPVEPSPKFQL